jgi:hypothetical protein
MLGTNRNGGKSAVQLHRLCTASALPLECRAHQHDMCSIITPGNLCAAVLASLLPPCFYVQLIHRADENNSLCGTATTGHSQTVCTPEPSTAVRTALHGLKPHAPTPAVNMPVFHGLCIASAQAQQSPTPPTCALPIMH